MCSCVRVWSLISNCVCVPACAGSQKTMEKLLLSVALFPKVTLVNTFSDEETAAVLVSVSSASYIISHCNALNVRVCVLNSNVSLFVFFISHNQAKLVEMDAVRGRALCIPERIMDACEQKKLRFLRLVPDISLSDACNLLTHFNWSLQVCIAQHGVLVFKKAQFCRIDRTIS